MGKGKTGGKPVPRNTSIHSVLVHFSTETVFGVNRRWINSHCTTYLYPCWKGWISGRQQQHRSKRQWLRGASIAVNRDLDLNGWSLALHTIFKLHLPLLFTKTKSPSLRLQEAEEACKVCLLFSFPKKEKILLEMGAFKPKRLLQIFSFDEPVVASLKSMEGLLLTLDEDPAHGPYTATHNLD